MIKSIQIILLSLLAHSALAEQLLISPNLYIEYERPKLIFHSGKSILIKYEDWSFSHEDTDPETIYQGIDLSGLEHDYIESIFIPSLRDNFPPWLAALSKEQAEFFIPIDARTSVKEFSKIKLYSSYIDKSQEGNIFILEERSVHHIQMQGNKDFHTKLLMNIKER